MFSDLLYTDKALPVPVKAVDCTYDRLAQLLNETQDIVSGPAAAALGRTGDVKPGAVNSTFLQSNNQKLLNSTFDGEQPPAQKLANNPNANATFDHKHMIAATNKTFDRLEHQMAANTTFEMADNNLINTTFDRKENQQANTTFDFQAGTEAKNENLNITFEKGEYRIPSMNETVNLMDAEGDVLKLILDSTPKKSSKAAPEAASTPKGAAKPQIASKGTITKDPTQSFLHRMSLNLRNEQVKAAVPESSQQPVAEPHSHTQAPSNKNAVPGFKMGHLDQQAMSTQLRRLHNGPTAVRSTSGPMRALPMHAFPLHQSCGKQVENAISPDDEGITALDYNTPTESSIKDAKPTFGSISSIENERPCTPDIGIAMDHRTSTPDVFRPGDPGSGPRITSTPAMRGGVFSRMVGMDGPAPTPIIAPIPRLQRVVSIASTGSLPESCQDPQWPGLSHDSTKDSKGGIGTPANHHSGRAIQAVKLNHRSGVNLMADSNEVDIQDKKSEPLLQNEDFDKVIPSLDTGKEVEEEEIVDSQRLIQDGDKQGAINKQFPAAQGNSQQACDGLPGETVRRKEVTKDLKKDCQEILNRTLDLQPSTDVNVDGSQATNNENEINVEEPDVLAEKMPSGNVHQSEFRNNTTKPLVDHEVRADCEKQIDTAVITKSQSSSSIEVKANYEASDACEPDLPININKKNSTLSIVPQVIQSIQTEVCLNDTFEAEQSDSSAKIKTEDYHIQKDNIPVDKNNLPEGPGKDICAESKVNNSQAEKPRPKRNKSAESNESSNNEGESHTSSEMNAEPNRQTKLKRSSLTHARKVPTPVSSTKPNLKTTKKLDTSKSSTYSNTSFSKTDQKTSMKKVGGQSSRPTATNNKNPQAMARPALGIRRSLPHSSPSQKSNNSITKSNKENTLGKQVDGNIKQPETQIKSKLSLTKGINPPKRTVLGSSNIQIRKSIVVQPEKQKNGLAFTKNSPLRANTGALKNKDPGESLKVRTKSVQSNSTYGQDKDNKTTSQIRLKPLSKRMKPSSPHKSPSKAELKQPQKLPQPTQKIAVASHTSGFTNKLARPQMASGLQTPAAQSKITSSGNSAVSKLPGLRPLSNIKPVAVKRVSGIMPPTTNKPNVLRPPRPMAR
ncbi:uncharacterized protein LOC125029964 [Penaeus chinensis]|uniref:uncharacterized protein LOC125029964 n=1 Tax=Penaeus chinensis TaxID=139456 RepID=UPI001FB7F42A|nr:uncharacterized protein LOC125029964 [Penaeus chinensis]